MRFALIFNRKILIFAISFMAILPNLYAVKKKINGLPNISTRRKDSSNNWIISADLLAWFASEEVSSIWADVITVGFNTSSWEAVGFNFKWDYGFRIGLGRDLIYDQWDVMLYWTRFCTDARNTIFHKSNATIIPEFYAAFLSGNTPQSVSVKWSLFFNMFDCELGRSYLVSRCLSLRPFLGIKGGWIDQSIHGQYFNLTIDKVLTNNLGNERLKNNFWGIGPVGGIYTKWRIRNLRCNSFNFFGDFSVATMWGRWTCEDIYKNTISQTSSVNMKNSTLGALMFRGFMGIGWDVNFNTDKSHFSTRLGYEMQFWLNQLRLATFQLQRLHGDLSFQGITFNCCIDF